MFICYNIDIMSRSSSESPPPEDFYLEILRSSDLNPAARLAVQGLVEVITRERSGKERADVRAITDELTGLGNRRALEERKAVLERFMTGTLYRQEDRRPYAVVVANADVIGLKKFNQQSQQTGDQAIQVVGRSLAAVFRDNEWFRRGGDEFVGLMPVDDEEGLGIVMAKLVGSVPHAYAELRQGTDLEKRKTFPVICATAIYKPGGDYPSLEVAERASDPKTEGRNNIVSFRPAR